MITVYRYYRRGAYVKQASYPHATLATTSDHFRKIGCNVRRVPAEPGIARYECRNVKSGVLVAEIEETIPVS